MGNFIGSREYRAWRFSIVLAASLAATSAARAATPVNWFTFSGSGTTATGTQGTDTIQVNTADGGTIVGPNEATYDASFPYSPTPVPGLGLRDFAGPPDPNTYSYDFTQVADPSSLTISVQDIDQSAGSVTFSASNRSNQHESLASLVTVGQYLENGVSGSNNTVTLNADGSITVTSAHNNTDDTKAIYFTGVPADLGTLLVIQTFGQSSSFDTIDVNVGHVVPEPASLALVAAVAACGVLRRRRNRRRNR